MCPSIPRVEEARRRCQSPGTGVTAGCELPALGAGTDSQSLQVQQHSDLLSTSPTLAVLRQHLVRFLSLPLNPLCRQVGLELCTMYVPSACCGQKWAEVGRSGLQIP